MKRVIYADICTQTHQDRLFITVNRKEAEQIIKLLVEAFIKRNIDITSLEFTAEIHESFEE